MTRRRALAATAALAALLATAACSGDDSYDQGFSLLPPSAAPTGQATGSAADTSCNPRASLRPAAELPEPGRMPAGSLRDIQQRGRLILGTSQDTLLFSSRNPRTGAIEGFDVDLGRRMAKAILGDENKLQIKVIPYEDRVEVVQRGEVDLVADTMTATCDRWRDVDFSSVYYDAGQKVLVAAGSQATGIDDLGGAKVCSVRGSTSYTNLERAASKPVPVARKTFGECLVAFQRNEVDAVSTDDTILAGMAAQDPYAKVVGAPMSEEPYAIAVHKGNPELTRLVNGVLEQMRTDGSWTAAYRRWLGDLGKAPAPPAAEYRD